MSHAHSQGLDIVFSNTPTENANQSSQTPETDSLFAFNPYSKNTPSNSVPYSMYSTSTGGAPYSSFFSHSGNDVGRLAGSTSDFPYLFQQSQQNAQRYFPPKSQNTPPPNQWPYNYNGSLYNPNVANWPGVQSTNMFFGTSNSSSESTSTNKPIQPPPGFGGQFYSTGETVFEHPFQIYGRSYSVSSPEAAHNLKSNPNNMWSFGNQTQHNPHMNNNSLNSNSTPVGAFNPSSLSLPEQTTQRKLPTSNPFIP
eukprot:TRINITY_DN9272_c0_g1_i1.p1 TRINITY_DN9272_c0_g1~~TRINITY_DN9272_c0_g1_i1.p1  ORF type:complete len:275 (-),score=53.28 TRINITY_DN9272_c0_g1_i1:188-946(-)